MLIYFRNRRGENCERNRKVSVTRTMTLAMFRVGQRLRGLLPDRAVLLLAVDPIDAELVEIYYRDESGRSGTRTRMVGYSIEQSVTSGLSAARCRQPVHRGHRAASCDCGSQFRTAAFAAVIKAHGYGLFHGSRPNLPRRRGYGDPSFCPRSGKDALNRYIREMPLANIVRPSLSGSTAATAPKRRQQILDIHTHRMQNDPHLNNIDTDLQPKQQQTPLRTAPFRSMR